MMRDFFSSRRRVIGILILVFFVVAIAVGVFISQQQQNLQQNAATGADLVIDGFQLTDAAGNLKTTFAPNEDIFIKVTLKNQGSARGVSVDGSTYTQIYANKASIVADGTVSDVNMSLKNGEFGTGASLPYGSAPLGTNRSRFVGAVYSWKKTTTGPYTARVFVNFDKKVQETNYKNNQLSVTYTVADLKQQGIVTKTKPSNFSTWPTCVEPTSELVSGLRGCVGEGIGPNGKGVGRVRNTSSSQTVTVGIASYKAYLPYPSVYPTCDPGDCIDQFNWIWTQTYFDSKTVTLGPGETAYFTVSLPSCAWQVDVFKGQVIPSFIPKTQYYSGKKTYLDGYYNTKLSVCKPVIPPPSPTPTVKVTPTRTPTPKPTATITPTLPPGVTPTLTHTPTPTVTHTPSPTLTSTPTPTRTPTPFLTATPTLTITPSVTLTSTPTPILACPVPKKVMNVRVTCPVCSSQ